MPTCWTIAGLHGAGKTTFALQYLPGVAHCRRSVNNASEPALVFKQKPAQRTVIDTVFFELLEKESQS